MLFNSVSFLIFLAASLPLYYLLPARRRKAALLVLSYAFYGLWNIPYLLLLAAATAAAYASALRIEKAKTTPGKMKALSYSLALLLASLVIFKYSGVLAALLRVAGSTTGVFDKVLVPLGISYYTFKLISYVVDVYWEKIPAEKDPITFALYPAFFPQILSGPIQRSEEFLSQIRRPLLNDPDRIASGLRLMLFGYFKKLVVADSLAPFVNQVYTDPLSYNSPAVLLACYAYVFQLYADFSGFTDIAIGTGRLFGIQSPKNFNMPFYSSNLQEFWRGWHMTLTRWLADYVFMPLRMAFRSWGSWGIAAAITVNFVAIGLWHGATGPFLAFGLLHSLFMCVSVFTLQRRNAFFERSSFLSRGRLVWAPILTFHLWTVSEVFFRAHSLEQAQNVFQAVFTFDLTKPWVFTYGKKSFLMLVWPILVMEAIHWIHAKGRMAGLLYSKPLAVRWAAYYALTLMVLYQCARGSQQFIYFQF